MTPSSKFNRQSIILAFWLFIFPLTACPIWGQTTDNFENRFPQGLSAGYGFGRYSIRDEYISLNRYTGMFSELNLEWSHYHGGRGFELEFAYGHGSEIKNYNAKADIYELTLSGKYLYPIKETLLFQKPVYLYLGPCWNSFVHFRNQNMASSIFTKTMSFATLISAGINTKCIIPLSAKFQTENSLTLHLISFAGRLPDMDIEDAKYIRLLTFPWAIDSQYNFTLRYRMNSNLSIATGYQFKLIKVHSSESSEEELGWYGMLSANNNVFIDLRCHF